jgi:hypothetical protein
MAISRQREWQIKQKQKGLCSICSEKVSIESKTFCQKHLDYSRKLSLQQWRLSKGKPLDAPLHSKTGRPRGIGGPKLPKKANELIGTTRDSIIAKLYKVSGTTVRNRRLKLGIARFQTPEPSLT